MTPLERVAKDVSECLSVVETKVSSLMSWHKWEMGMIAAILLLAIKNWMR